MEQGQKGSERKKLLIKGRRLISLRAQATMVTNPLSPFLGSWSGRPSSAPLSPIVTVCRRKSSELETRTRHRENMEDDSPALRHQARLCPVTARRAGRGAGAPASPAFGHHAPLADGTPRLLRMMEARYAERASSSAKMGLIRSANAAASAAFLSLCALWPPYFFLVRSCSPTMAPVPASFGAQPCSMFRTDIASYGRPEAPT
jgi:hypothetical protein